MAKFNAKRAAKLVNKLKIPGVKAKVITPGGFTDKQKAAIKKARRELRK